MNVWNPGPVRLNESPRSVDGGTGDPEGVQVLYRCGARKPHHHGVQTPPRCFQVPVIRQANQGALSGLRRTRLVRKRLPGGARLRGDTPAGQRQRENMLASLVPTWEEPLPAETAPDPLAVPQTAHGPGRFSGRRIDDSPPRNTEGQSVKDPDTNKKLWLQFRLQASNGFVGLPNRLVDSKAFAALTTGASVKTLIWFWQEVKYEKKKRKPGTELPIGKIYKIINNGEISFTFQVAEWRGIKLGRFARALKELFRLGFIDINRLGRGVGGEYTKYAISTRWQKYGTSEWQEIPYPENFHEGFRSDGYKEKRRAQSRKNSVQKWTLPTSKNGCYKKAKLPHNIHKQTQKTALCVESQRLITDVSIDLVMPPGTSDGIKKKGSDPELKIHRKEDAKFQRDESHLGYPWAEDEPTVMTLDGYEAIH